MAARSTAVRYMSVEGGMITGKPSGIPVIARGKNPFGELLTLTSLLPDVVL